MFPNLLTPLDGATDQRFRPRRQSLCLGQRRHWIGRLQNEKIRRHRPRKSQRRAVQQRRKGCPWFQLHDHAGAEFDRIRRGVFGPRFHPSGLRPGGRAGQTVRFDSIGCGVRFTEVESRHARRRLHLRDAGQSRQPAEKRQHQNAFHLPATVATEGTDSSVNSPSAGRRSAHLLRPRMWSRTACPPAVTRPAIAPVI